MDVLCATPIARGWAEVSGGEKDNERAIWVWRGLRLGCLFFSLFGDAPEVLLAVGSFYGGVVRRASDGGQDTARHAERGTVIILHRILSSRRDNDFAS